MMSAIAGIWHWDGRPVPERQLTALAEHSRLYGPDGGGSVSLQAGLTLQAHVLRFDRLSSAERQPHCFPDGTVITWDGRLDNREDLLVSLHNDLGPVETDAAVAGAAYVRWGLDALPRLIGDWSVAIWDAPNRRLLLARDCMGNRPLYYFLLADGIAWATSAEALASAFDRLAHPSDAFIVGKLINHKPPGCSPFEGVLRLRAGHVLTASTSGAVVQRYWQYQPVPIHYRSTRASTDQLRHLLTEAVRVRLRARGTVWSELSGGWDSSTVVCLAQSLIQRHMVEADSLQTTSMLTSASPESDERCYIDAVVRWTGVGSTRSEATLVPSFADLQAHWSPYRHGSARRAILAPARAAGDQIMLSGILGDSVMVGAGYGRRAMLEPLYRGRPIEFLRICNTRTREKHQPLLNTIFHLMADAYLPRRHNHLLGWFGLRGQAVLRESETSPHFGLSKTLIARLPSTTESYLPDLAHFSALKRGLVAEVYAAADVGAICTPEEAPDIWRTYPYAHRPLIEFLLSSPNLAFWDPIKMRLGMERAFSDVLPPEILARETKGLYSYARTRESRERMGAFATQAHVLGSAHTWQLVKRGYLESDAVALALSRLMANDSHASKLVRIWLPLEIWLRKVSDAESFPPMQDLHATTA